METTAVNSVVIAIMKNVIHSLGFVEMDVRKATNHHCAQKVKNNRAWKTLLENEMYKFCLRSKRSSVFTKLLYLLLSYYIIFSKEWHTFLYLQRPTHADLIYWKYFYFSHFITIVTSSSGNSAKQDHLPCNNSALFVILII